MVVLEVGSGSADHRYLLVNRQNRNKDWLKNT
jgi:hypothetical protein